MKNATKYNIILALLFFVIWGMTGCLKDDSANSLVPVNKIIIEDTSPGVRTVLQFDTLRIQPVIRQSIQAELSGLRFKWSVREATNYQTAVTVLDSTMYLNKAIGLRKGNYTVVYEVTDMKSGVMSMKYFDLTVTDRLGKGWLLLEEQGGKGDVSVIVPTEEIFRNVYSDLNPQYPLKTPLRQIVVTETYSGKKIDIISDNDAIQLDYAEMIKLLEFKDYFWTTPGVVKPEYYAGLSLTSKIMINDGLLYMYVEGGFPGDVRFLSELPYINNKGTDYALAPFAAAGPEMWDGTTPYGSLYYDKKSKGFAYVTNATMLPSMAAFGSPAPGAAFDMRSVGMEMLSMDAASGPHLYNAVFRDGNSDIYICQIDLDLPDPGVSKIKVSADLSASTLFASSKTNQFIYLVRDNVVYLYDMPLKSYTEAARLPAGETVTKMKVSAGQMQISTWDGKEGRFYLFDIDARGGIRQSKKYGGFARIVDFTYKS